MCLGDLILDNYFNLRVTELVESITIRASLLCLVFITLKLLDELTQDLDGASYTVLMVTIGHGCLLAEVSLRLAQKSTTLTQLLVALANIAHADRKKVHLDLSDFFFHQLLVKTLINLH